MNIKYSDKVKELELVGQYVDRLGMIESNLSQDVDEGNIVRDTLTLLTNCIDMINRVYIEGEKKYSDGCFNVKTGESFGDNNGTQESEVI